MFDDLPANEVTFARGRLTERTYVSRTFRLDLRASADYGQPARFVSKVFDESPTTLDRDTPGIDWEDMVISTTPGGRKQIKLQVAREAGQIREIQIQKVPADPTAERMDVLLNLNREQSARLIELVRSLDYIPADGSKTVRLDDDLIRQLFTDSEALEQLYSQDPERVRTLIETDASASDVLALAHRQAAVSEFRRLLDDDDAFAEASRECGGPEDVWQDFLENNPWILGISLSGQLLTSWDDGRLEQTVAGFRLDAAGKRVDALLRTNGQISSLVFAEIKHHKTPLLQAKPYRSACWGPSTELAGGAAQAQTTVERALDDLGERLIARDESGAESGDQAFLVRPRSFLIVGHLRQLVGPGGGVNTDKYRSFELYRRHLLQPEVLTFDELLARAEWHVSLSHGESIEPPQPEWDW